MKPRGHTISAAPILLSVLIGLLTLPNLSEAAWRHARQGVGRTGTTTLPTPIANPQVFWRHYLGGQISQRNIAVVRLKDERALALVSAQRLSLVGADNVTRWRTPNLGAMALIGAVDLDGDNQDEILVVVNQPYAKAYVAIHDGRTGAQLWRTEDGRFGGLRVEWIRLVDIDGDGRPELYVSDAGVSNGKNNSSLYGFADGVPQGKKLWDLDSTKRDYYLEYNTAFGDFDGDGQLELLIQGHKQLYLYSAATGKLKHQTAVMPVPMPYGLATAFVTDIDDDQTHELLALSNGPYTPTSNSKRAVLFAWDKSAGTLAIKWERKVDDLANDALAFSAESLIDLDGNGTPELVLSQFSHAKNVWTLKVIKIADGSDVATLDGYRFLGATTLGQSRVVLAEATATKALTILTLDGQTLSAGPSLPGSLLLSCFPLTLIRRVRAEAETCVVDVAGQRGLLSGSQDPSGQTQALTAFGWTATPASVTALATYTAKADRRILTWAHTPGLHSAGSPLTVNLSNGRLVILSSTLTEVNTKEDPQFPVLGILVGSHYSGPNNLTSFPLGDDLLGRGRDQLLLIDSKGTLTVLDPQKATLVEPGEIITTVAGARRAVIARGEKDSRRLVVIADTQIRLLKPNGDVVWEKTIFDQGGPRVALYDPLAVDLNGDGVDDVLYQVQNLNGNQYSIGALSGVDGTALWPEQPLESNNTGWRRLSFFDADGDGVPEILSGRLYEIWALNAADGSILRKITSSRGQLAVETGIATHRLLSVGFDNLELFDTQNTASWTSTFFMRHNYGSLLTCAAGAHYTIAPDSSAELRAVALSDGGTVWSVVLASGKSFTSSSLADAAGVTIGTLGNTTSAPDGKGGTLTLVGSSDGFLYGLDGCSGTLRWAVDLGAPVGESIIVDTDGDKSGEIVVSVADGYVYGIDEQTGDKVPWVYDLDPTSSTPTEDVDQIESFDTLYTRWSTVAGALSYEVAVFTTDGAPVSDGYVTVTATDATLTGLPLKLGLRYQVAVRAIVSNGKTPETLSDGVLIVDESDPTVTLDITPELVPTNATLLTIRCNATDRGGLGTLKIQLLDAQGAPLAIVSEPTVTGTTLDHSVNYASWQALTDGQYQIACIVTDRTGHTTTRTTTFSLNRHGSDEILGGGCGCRQHVPNPPAVWPWLLSLGLIVWIRRRRRV